MYQLYLILCQETIILCIEVIQGKRLGLLQQTRRKTCQIDFDTIVDVPNSRKTLL